MGVIRSIRNFFYAATHANQLVREVENARSTIALQQSELTSIRSAVETAYQEKNHWKAMYEKSKSKPTIPRPENMNTNQPVGKIEYLDTRGEVFDSMAYMDAAQFVQQIKEDNYCGVPMDITVFSDPDNGLHIDTSWRLDLDPPPQGFRIEPYQAETEMELDNFCSTGAEVPEMELEV